MNNNERLSLIEKRLVKLAENLDRSGFYDYINYVNDKKRIFRRSFINGIFRGIGTAIGFTLCAAVIILILNSIAESSIPYIADFISKILEILDKGG